MPAGVVNRDDSSVYPEGMETVPVPFTRFGCSAENLPVSQRDEWARLSKPYNGRAIDHRSVITISHASNHNIHHPCIHPHIGIAAK